jgi:DNA polymerase bacteriophage-type
VLYVDYETRCRLDLRQVGAYRYVAHSSFKPLILAWAEDDGPVRVVDMRCPEVADGMRGLFSAKRHAQWVAHNASFERLVTSRLYPSLGDCDDYWHDTQAQCRMCGLPPDLEGAAVALNLSYQKDPRGKKLIKQLTQPDKDGRFIEDEVLFAQFMDYAGIDVHTLRALHKRLPPQPPYERRIWQYDLKLNDRGIRIDRPLVERAQVVAEDTARGLNKRMHDLTGGAITTTGQIARILKHARDKGAALLSLGKKDVAALDAQSDDVAELLNIRTQGSRSSVRKLVKMLSHAGSDDRLRGMLVYHGASTGRHSSRIVQLQNLPRPSRGYDDIKAGIAALETANHVLVQWSEGAPLDVIADCLRSMLVPTPGCQFAICDLNAIELRGAAWLAGERKIVETLAMGGDVYCDTASIVYGRTITPTDEKERFVGKTLALAAQYGANGLRIREACASAGIDLTQEFAARAVASYRNRYAAIPLAWNALEEAAKLACAHRGHIFVTHQTAWRCEKGMLLCRLPSGRFLTYMRPRVENATTTGKSGLPFTRPTLTYEGVNSQTHQYGDIRLWGSKIFENVVQALCRDFLMEGCFALEDIGYPVVLIVHDEVVVEHPSPDIGLIERVLAGPKSWAPDMPVQAKGKVSDRYRKI